MSVLLPDLEPVWLPGDVEVQVSGETFHAEAIRQADRDGPRGGPHVAVLVLDPGNPHDHSAIAVFVNGFLVGHLSREIAGAVQPSLIAFTAAPAMTGCGAAARSVLAAAEAQRSEADTDYERGATRWPQVERAFLQAIRQLELARDPLVADAWAGLARSVRYQKGRRDDRITAAVTSLYWDRSNKIAWAELVDPASAAPHVPTLLDLFRRVPADARPPVLTKLIGLSRGRDRLGNMLPADGESLRAELAAMAEAEGDEPTIRKLSADARKHQGSNA